MLLASVDVLWLNMDTNNDIHIQSRIQSNRRRQVTHHHIAHRSSACMMMRWMTPRWHLFLFCGLICCILQDSTTKIVQFPREENSTIEKVIATWPQKD